MDKKPRGIVFTNSFNRMHLIEKPMEKLLPQLSSLSAAGLGAVFLLKDEEEGESLFSRLETIIIQFNPPVLIPDKKGKISIEALESSVRYRPVKLGDMIVIGTRKSEFQKFGEEFRLFAILEEDYESEIAEETEEDEKKFIYLEDLPETEKADLSQKVVIIKELSDLLKLIR